MAEGRKNLGCERDVIEYSGFKRVLKNIKNKIDFIFGGNKIKCSGSNSFVYGQDSIFKECNIIVKGNNNRVIFGNNCSVNGLNIFIMDDNNLIQFGNNFIVNASKYQPTTINAIGGTKIIIGDSSGFSNRCDVHTTDYHSIFDENGNRYNHDKDITIGSFAWIGVDCKILKGAYIPDGTIIGAGSLVTGVFSEKNTVIAGNPAKVIRHNVTWSLERRERVD